jgi:hypothetical protein
MKWKGKLTPVSRYFPGICIDSMREMRNLRKHKHLKKASFEYKSNSTNQTIPTETTIQQEYSLFPQLWEDFDYNTQGTRHKHRS